MTFQREQVGCQETGLASRHGWHQCHPTIPLCAGHLILGFPGRIWAQDWQGQMCSLGTLWVNGALEFLQEKKGDARLWLLLALELILPDNKGQYKGPYHLWDRPDSLETQKSGFPSGSHTLLPCGIPWSLDPSSHPLGSHAL